MAYRQPGLAGTDDVDLLCRDTAAAVAMVMS